MPMTKYTVIFKKGGEGEVIAAGISFCRGHLLFMDSEDRSVAMLHKNVWQAIQMEIIDD